MVFEQDCQNRLLDEWHERPYLCVLHKLCEAELSRKISGLIQAFLEQSAFAVGVANRKMQIRHTQYLTQLASGVLTHLFKKLLSFGTIHG